MYILRKSLAWWVVATIFLSLLNEAVWSQQANEPPAKAEKAGSLVGAKGVITGRIVRDDGEPVIGENVMIFHSSIEDSQRSKQRYLTVATDDEGEFKSPELEYATYKVQVNVPGYVDSSLNNNLNKLIGGGTYLPGEHVNISLTPGGVITGKVTDTSGKPLVAATVNVVRVRDSDGIGVVADSGYFMGRTDDRGIYRVFGLPAGNYLVSTSGVGFASGLVREVVEYYPGGPIGAAQEVSVNLGAVASGIDIRHDGRTGHAVSGKIIPVGAGNGVVIVRVFSADGQPVSLTPTRNDSGKYFVPGLPDGDYYIIGYQTSDVAFGDIFAADSAPRKFSIKGNDIPGIDMKLRLTSGISGSVSLASVGTSCTGGKRIRADVISMSISPENLSDSVVRRSFRNLNADSKGNFSLSGIPSGRIRLEAELPGENWYIKSLTMPMAGTAKASRVDAGGWISLNSGAKVADIALAVSDGAAQVSGSAAVAETGRAFLVPVDKELAGEISRHYEVIGRSGRFAFRNIAPGKYWLLWKGGEVTESMVPEAFDTTARLALRKAAEAGGKMIELTPCQKLEGVKLGK